MKRRLSNQRTVGLTLVEVLVSIAVVALFAGLAILNFARAPKVRASRANCFVNLKQVGLGMRMWANDHAEKFPWSVSTNEGGTMEFIGTSEVFQHFLAGSNELTSPKGLTCPGDAQRTRATTWDEVTNDTRQISYFVGLDADETKPRSILSGDRHITTNGVRAVGLLTISMSSTIGWSQDLHGGLGNVAMGDGSAHQVSSAGTLNQLHGSLTNYGASSIRLVIP